MKKTFITVRRFPRPIPSKFIEYVKIGGDRSNVRYLYVGKTMFKVRRFKVDPTP